MVGCLISPLHNALQHRAAMRHATRDALTGAGNRMAMELAAEHEIALARRHRMPASLLVIDLDHFKRVNDSLGHAAGDRALIDTAELLRSTCRDSDSLFRFGGEEFVLLLSQTDEEGAAAIAERIREVVAEHWAGSMELTLSIGVATLEAGETLSSWFERADRALYVGKQGGRNRVVTAVRRGE
jgi:diguanylate cyclase (GGDEF)-like protein